MVTGMRVAVRTRLLVVTYLVGLLGVAAAVFSVLAWYRTEGMVRQIRDREALRGRVIKVQTDAFWAMKRFNDALDAVVGASEVETFFARCDSELQQIEAAIAVDPSVVEGAKERDRLFRLRVLVRERRRAVAEVLRRQRAGEEVGTFLKDNLSRQMDEEFLSLVSEILADIAAGVHRAEERLLVGAKRFRLTIGPIGVAVVAIMIALLLGTSRRISRSLRMLLEGTERLAAGDLEARVEIAGNDEFSRLARAFSDMASSLGASIKTAEKETGKREKIQSRLREAQKMEAIGRLAGGVAHDFNNLLQVINGYADMLLERLPEDSEDRGYASQIRRTGERAASVTRQLLAFGRRQLVQPRPISLNVVIAGMEGVMKRLVGEPIKIVTELAPDLKEVIADEAQVEHMLMNLIINAQQAMPEGGELTLRTANVTIEADSSPPELREVEPGPYALLVVSDTGVGIDPETLPHIFEPFFTTRDVGDGSGLGLASVYGSVKQSKGRISVHSEVGRGSSFRVYLPLVESKPEALVEERRSGKATVLVVEDSEPVRVLIQKVLERYGYRILAAHDAEQAIQMVEQFEITIDLLLTDVIMPGLSGRRLAEHLLRARPKMKVLYISGYPRDALLRHGVEQDQVPFLQKPFTESELLSMIYELLDPEEGGSG